MSDLEQDAAPTVVENDARSDVREAIASLKGDSSAVAALSADDSADASSPPGTTLQGRQRDEHGRFAPKVEADAPPATITDADPVVAAVPEPSKARQMPNYWSADVKAEVTKLSPAAQEAVFKRLEETDKAGTQWSEEKKTLLSHFEPVKRTSERHNVHPAEAIKRLAAAEEYMDRDPGGFIQWVAKQNGIDLASLAANPPTPQPQADPVVAELQSKVSRFEQMLEQQEMAQVNSTIAAFASAPGHENFEAVKTDMGHLMLTAQSMGRELSTDQAYEQACWANPDIRSKMIAAQTAAITTAAKQRETVDKARRGAVSINGAPSGTVAALAKADPNASMLDDVRSAVAQLKGH